MSPTYTRLLLITASVIVLVVSGVHQPAPNQQPSPSPTPKPDSDSDAPQDDCAPGVQQQEQSSHLGVEYKMVAGSNSHTLPEESFAKNCSTTGSGIHVRRGHNELWKTHVIIACTVTAAIEMVIVLVIVLYWRQLRWTFRKITCPCDERPRRGQHEVIDTSDSETEIDNGDPPEVNDLGVEGQQVQSFPGPSTSSGYTGVDMIDTSQV